MAPSLKDRLLESSIGYRLWMAPFAEEKFAPILANNDLSRARRVLDVGCGPGTNTHHFAGASYLGLDINEDYVNDARRRSGREFRAVDVTQYTAEENEQSDFILLNSFLHHLPTAGREAQLALIADSLESELARLQDLRRHHAEGPSLFLDWLDHDIAALAARVAQLSGGARAAATTPNSMA